MVDISQLPKDEEKKESRFGLPSIESVSALGTAGEEKRSTSRSLLDKSLLQQIKLTDEITADTEEDTQFVKQVSAAESEAQAAESKQRGGLMRELQAGFDDLEAAEEMNPFVRSLKALVDPGVKPSVIRKKLALDQQRLKLFQGGVAARKEKAKQAFSLFDARNKSQSASFKARQDGINSKIKLAGQYGSLALQELTGATKKIEFGLKLRMAQRKEMETILGRMSDDMVNQLEEEARADSTGTVDVNGVAFTIGDFEAQRKSRTRINLDLANAEIQLVNGRDGLAQTNYTRAVENMTVDQLQNAVEADGVIQLGDKKTAQIPLAILSQQLGIRLKEQQENLNLSTDFDQSVATATVEMDILLSRVGNVVGRVNSVAGANSGMSRQIGETVMRTTATLNSLAGVDGKSAVNLATLSQAVKEGLVSETNIRRIGKVSAEANEKLETQIEKMAASQFPEDKTSEQTLKNFFNGDSSTPANAMKTLVKMSVGGIPRGVIRESAIGLALEAGNVKIQQFMQANLSDPPDFGSMEPQERTDFLMQSLFDDKTGDIKPDNLGMLAQVSSVMYNAWLGNTVDNMLVNAVSIPNTPAFGQIDPSVIQSALQTATRQAEEQVQLQAKAAAALDSGEAQDPKDVAKDTNETAVIEATTFMRTLRGVRVGNTNAAELFIQQLDSSEFQEAIQQAGLGGNAASWPGYLLDNGAVQGNFFSDFASLTSTYKRINGDLVAEAEQRRAKLSELFAGDPNEQDLAFLKIAGHLEAGADPESVNAFVGEMIEQHGGDAAAIWDTINNARFKNQEQEKIRKSLVKARTGGKAVMDAIFNVLVGVSNPVSTLVKRAENVVENRRQRRDVFPNPVTRQAILNQEDFSIFPSKGEER